MESRARFLGHPIHQMLVMFPLGLLGGSVVFDLMAIVWPDAGHAEVAYALMSAGLLAGAIAAPFGTIDWVSLPAGTRARAVGALHGTGNVVMLALFAGSWWLRRDDPAAPEAAARWLSFGAAGLSLVTAWLGGELVNRLGVGVSPNAHLDAKSSLKGPAEPPQRPRPQ